MRLVGIVIAVTVVSWFAAAVGAAIKNGEEASGIIFF
jgi:hypothetical protein